MSRILLSIHHRRQRELLRQWLAGENEVAAPPRIDAAAAEWQAFELAIVDPRTLLDARSVSRLRERPLLLVCSHRALSGLDTTLASAVDDVSLTPLTRPDVERRVAALLAANRGSAPRPPSAAHAGWWSDERLAFVLESGEAGIWDWDTQTGQFNISQNLEAAYGLPRGGLDSYERFLETIHPEDRAQLISQLLRGARKGEPVRLEFRSLWPDGSVHWIAMQSRGTRDETGKVVRIAGLVTNIDARKAAEQTLRHDEERLRLAVEGADIGLWDWDISGDRIYYSERWKRQLGFTGDEFPDRIEEWDRRLHPEDRERMRKAAVTYLQQPGPSHQVEFRLRHKDGSYRWISSRAAVLLDADGRPTRMLGAHIDITERKRAEITTTVLLGLAGDVSAASSRDELLDRVQRRVAQSLSCDAVAVVYREPEVDTFRVIAHHGIPEPLAEAAMAVELSPRHLLKGRFIGQGVTVTIDDTKTAAAPIAALGKQFGFRALMAAPLYVRGHALGALLGFRVRRGMPFEGGEVDLFNAIAQQVAVALESLDLRRMQLEETQVTSAIAHLGQALVGSLDPTSVLNRACEETMEALGCASAYVLLRDGEHLDVVTGRGESFEDLEALPVRLPMAVLGPFFDRLRRYGVVQVSPKRGAGLGSDLMSRFGISATLNVPLTRDGEIIGLLAAARREPQGGFTALDKRIVRGIGELVSVALERARLVQETERANKVRAEFVATMSHELRTPLNIIIGYNALLLDAAYGALTPEQRQALERVGVTTNQLLELVEAVLDLSRLEGGQIPLQLESVGLPGVIAEICDEVAPMLQDMPCVKCVRRYPAELPDLRTDRRKLKVLVKNLVGNAIKFTDRGTVSIAASVESDRMQIEVADTGIGIAPEVMPTIFEAFQQGDGSSTRAHGGVGLGLYIVRRLVAELGGTITVESDLGRGSTFRVLLPIGGPLPSKIAAPAVS